MYINSDEHNGLCSPQECNPVQINLIKDDVKFYAVADSSYDLLALCN